MNTHFSRRHAILAVSTLGLGSCASLRQQSAFWGTIADGFGGSGKSPVDRARSDTIKFASMAVWFSGAPRGMFILEEAEADGSLIWGAPKQQLVTRGPWVTRTSGLEIDLVSSDFGVGWLKDIRKLVGRRVTRTLTFGADRRNALEVASRFLDDGSETIEIYDRRFTLQRIVERVSSKNVHRFSNHYWLDEDGFCWKSQQTVAPTSTPLNIEILRRPLAMYD